MAFVCGNPFYSPELHLNKAFFPSPSCLTGNYRIDPNGGSPEDRFMAFCNFTKQATCIKPKVNKVCYGENHSNKCAYAYIYIHIFIFFE